MPKVVIPACPSTPVNKLSWMMGDVELHKIEVPSACAVRPGSMDEPGPLIAMNLNPEIDASSAPRTETKRSVPGIA